MNLTVLLQGVLPSDQIGYHSAFERALQDGRLDGYTAFPYRQAKSHDDWRRLWASVTSHMHATGSDALLLQYFHERDVPDPRPYLKEIAEQKQRPIIVTSCGDPFGPRLAAPPAALVRAAQRSDMTFSTSMGRLADTLTKAGAARVTLMPNAACDVRFGSALHPHTGPGTEFDVVFVGNRPGGRNFTSHYFWSGRRRSELVMALSQRFGDRFGLFGRGWEGLPGWQGPVQFEQQAAATSRGRVAFGGYPSSYCTYYTSDRFFIGPLSGSPFVDFDVPRVDRFMRRDEEVWFIRDERSMLHTVEALLEHDDAELARLGEVGVRAIRGRHLASHRVSLMLDFMDEVLRAKRLGRVAKPPPMPFFHEGVDATAEAPHCLRGW